MAARTKRGPGRYDRSQPAAERRAEQRLRLLGAAARVFAQRGYARASVAAIVRQSRMSRRTFYEHFDDLSTALLAVYDLAATTLFEAVEARVRAEHEPIAKLGAGVQAFLALYADNAALARVLNREIRAAGPSHAKRHEATLARFAGLISEGVAEAHVAGLAARAPDELTVYTIVAGIEAVAMRHLDRGEERKLLDAAPKLVELIMCAFGAGPPSAAATRAR